jgi:hypothetical protein
MITVPAALFSYRLLAIEQLTTPRGRRVPDIQKFLRLRKKREHSNFKIPPQKAEYIVPT